MALAERRRHRGGSGGLCRRDPAGLWVCGVCGGLRLAGWASRCELCVSLLGPAPWPGAGDGAARASPRGVFRLPRPACAQLPPMWSSSKYRNRPLRWYAERGEAVPREPKAVHVAELQVRGARAGACRGPAPRLLLLTVRVLRATGVARAGRGRGQQRSSAGKQRCAARAARQRAALSPGRRQGRKRARAGARLGARSARTLRACGARGSAASAWTPRGRWTWCCRSRASMPRAGARPSSRSERAAAGSERVPPSSSRRGRARQRAAALQRSSP